LPPSSGPPPDDGGDYYVCNVFEWTATNMEKGDPCWYSKGRGAPWEMGVFKLAWFYDGVIADVTALDGSTVGLLLSLHDRIILPEDRDTLQQWENLRP